MLRFYWLKKLANCYGQSFARIRDSPEKKESGRQILAKSNQFNIIRIGKKVANPYESGEHRFSGESLVFND